MKVFIYSQWQNLIEKSGIGRAVYHQKKALSFQDTPCVSSKKEADVVHINTIFPGSITTAKWAKRHNLAVVCHAHSTREDFRNSFIGSNVFAGLFGKWIKFCYEQGDCIITPSQYSAKLLRSYGIKKPVFVLSNGIDITYYKRKEDDRETFREEYGYSDQEKVIMSVGLWIKRKGILDFVKMAQAMPQYQFIWFGETDLHTVPSEIREAVSMRLPNLRFAGYVSKEKLRRAYAACDLFLFPSYEETEGIVVLEALAMKIPVLLRNIPVYEGWLEDKKNVYMANHREEFESIAAAILEDKIENLTEFGYEVAKKRDLRRVGKQLVQIYEEAEKRK